VAGKKYEESAFIWFAQKNRFLVEAVRQQFFFLTTASEPLSTFAVRTITSVEGHNLGFDFCLNIGKQLLHFLDFDFVHLVLCDEPRHGV